jgi:enoyl-CoA hydratase/carnithine racemase
MPTYVNLDTPAESITRIVLNRPEKKNALSIALREEVSDALDALAADSTVKCVVITGAGDTFSAGFDLREFEDPSLADELWASSDRFHAAVLNFPLPLVAAVNGPALAGGFDLAVMCDIRIAAESARFAHPEITFGDVVYGPLHDLAGAAVARELCFTGRPVDAAEALRLGLVASVVPLGALEAETQRYAEMVVRAPRDVLLRTKAKALRRARLTAGLTLDL